MTDEKLNELEAGAEAVLNMLGDEPRETTREDYVAADGHTAVSVYTFPDGSSLKAWTSDEGETFTTRDVDRNGISTLGSTRKGLTADDVEALVAERGDRP